MDHLARKFNYELIPWTVFWITPACLGRFLDKLGTLIG